MPVESLSNFARPLLGCDGESKKGETKKGETKKGETKKGESIKGGTKKGESKSETKKGETKKGETKKGETKKGETKKGETKKGETKKGETKKGKTKRNMPMYRWGIVGAGKVSNDFVNSINSYPGKGNQAVVAVAARDRARAEEFASKYGIPQVFDSYQAMAQSIDVIDIAYIAVLNPDHYSLTRLFLEHGKHVLCEQPLCLNEKQVQSLVILAKQKKRFLMEAIWSRFAPAYRCLAEQIAAGKLGALKHLEVDYGLPLMDVDRFVKKELGGGSLINIGEYGLQLAQFVFGDAPTNITVVGELNSSGVDTGESIILEYPGGRRAVINIDMTIKMWNRATVYGSKGRATLDESFNFPERLICADNSVAMFRVHHSDVPYNFGPVSAGHVYMAMECVRCLQKGLLESSQMSHRESIALAKLTDSIRKQLGVKYDVDD